MEQDGNDLSIAGSGTSDFNRQSDKRNSNYEPYQHDSTTPSVMPQASNTKRSGASLDRSSPNGSPSKRLETGRSGDNAELSDKEGRKIILYIDNLGLERRIYISDQESLQIFLAAKNAYCLRDDDGIEAICFKDLQYGATYTFGSTAAAPAVADIAVGPILPRRAFDYTSMQKAQNVRPMRKMTRPTFVCNTGWLRNIKRKIEKEMANKDCLDPEFRVPPMALVRCGRGGKTRALNEVANQICGANVPIAIVSIAFNGYSSLTKKEQLDPLQALCQRIAFEASRDRGNEGNIIEEYRVFRNENFFIDPVRIVEWLGNTPAILFVDELNMVKDLTYGVSDIAEPLGFFIKENFLASEGRYFVFSTHAITTTNHFAKNVDCNKNSSRQVSVFPLPLVDNILEAKDCLNTQLSGPVDAIFHGLIPALIYVQRSWKAKQNDPESDTNQTDSDYGEKVKAFVDEYINNGSLPEKRDQDFKDILTSLFTGDFRLVPQELHILLDAATETRTKLIRWVPFMLHHVLTLIEPTLTIRSGLAGLCEDLRLLLEGFKNAGHKSGDQWEYLFTFQLVARCCVGLNFDPVVPGNWCARTGVAVKYNDQERLAASNIQYTNWRELLAAMVLTDVPTIFIFHAGHSSFAVFDVIVLFWDNSILLDFYGIQLIKGRTSPSSENPAPINEIRAHCKTIRTVKCIWVRGDPPKRNLECHGWDVLSEEAIDGFFGVSGCFWTPQKWKLLLDTSPV